MNAVVEFAKLLSRAHRIYGQYKRVAGFESFYNVKSFEDLVGYKTPKKITRGSVKRLKRAINDMAKKYEHYKYKYIENPEWEEALNTCWKEFSDSNALYIEQIDYGQNEYVANKVETGLIRLHDAIEDAYVYALEYWRMEFKKYSIYDETGLKKREDYKKSIEDFLVLHGKELKRFAYAVVDTNSGGFNTNAYFLTRDSKGQLGRTRFKTFVDRLCRAWWIPQMAPYIVAKVII